jgi:glycosyltransferase involved in cell wall biosynthesis
MSSTVWAVALFAHNEARTIQAAVESVRAASDGRIVHIAVLANGCTDDTVAIVRKTAAEQSAVLAVEIPRADKANAWNVYVHDVLRDERFASASLHAFMDGDVRAEPGAIAALHHALNDVPTAHAAGGMPVTGRDRDAWRQRMVAGGTLAGNLYALRASFVSRLRGQGVRIPIGLIGEDWLVSYLARTDLRVPPVSDGHPRVVFTPRAGFWFRSLNPLNPRDCRIYARRLWRYALRGAQFEMLMPLLERESLAGMPRDVDELYRRGGLPSRMKWTGRMSILRTLAIQHIRIRRRAGHV